MIKLSQGDCLDLMKDIQGWIPSTKQSNLLRKVK